MTYSFPMVSRLYEHSAFHPVFLLPPVKTDPDIELSKEVSSTSTSLSTVVDKETSPMQSLIPRRGFVSLLRIDSLLESLETISDAKESKICRMIRRADTQGKYGHEFLLVETHDSLKHTLWIRLERAADLARRAGVWSRSSTFVPDDTARLASSLEDLIRDEGSEIKAEVEFTEPDTVTLYTLQLLLSCFIAESKKYTLVGENCWFFCSVVLSMLSERYPHRMKGTVGNWGHGLMDSRDRIQKVFLKKLVELGAISGPGIHEKGSKVQGDLSLQSAAGSVVSALGLTPRRHDSEETVVATNESYIHKGTTSNSTTSFGYVGSPFYCFSNFSPYPFTFKGKRYPTSQHLFVSLMVNLFAEFFGRNFVDCFSFSSKGRERCLMIY
jgi:hypothetical protein